MTKAQRYVAVASGVVFGMIGYAHLARTYEAPFSDAVGMTAAALAAISFFIAARRVVD
jgi:hypothetical protein